MRLSFKIRNYSNIEFYATHPFCYGEYKGGKLEERGKRTLMKIQQDLAKATEYLAEKIFTKKK